MNSSIELHETDHPIMTATDSVAELFGQFGAPDRGLEWLADQLIAAAMERSVVLIEAIPTENAGRVLYVLSHPPVWVEHFRVSVFRPLLAFFAGIGRKETGAAVNPYGDRFMLIREIPGGSVELFVDFKNTPGMQRLQIVRSPLPADRPRE
jgi:hypothetical protein